MFFFLQAQLYQTWRILRRSSGRLLLSFVMSLQSLGHQLPMYAYGPTAEMDQWSASLNARYAENAVTTTCWHPATPVITALTTTTITITLRRCWCRCSRLNRIYDTITMTLQIRISRNDIIIVPRWLVSNDYLIRYYCNKRSDAANRIYERRWHSCNYCKPPTPLPPLPDAYATKVKNSEPQ